jgi:hypothetical protein
MGEMGRKDVYLGVMFFRTEGFTLISPITSFLEVSEITDF